ncbi:MAG: alanine racemase [Pseudanabaenales cyanobacterium]|nr:alanine racemase [Pseudanabaenales cyanobacterium]
MIIEFAYGGDMNPALLQSIQHESSWCEISAPAIGNNMEIFRRRIGPDVALGVVVKSNGFGHGLLPCARAFLAAGADWLIVNFVQEAIELRQAGIDASIYICGNVSAAQAQRAAEARARVVLYDLDVARALAQAGRETGVSIPVHLKLETGTHRQGLPLEEAIALARQVSQLEGVVLEGLATHYADIEDTTDHRFAHEQLAQLEQAQHVFRQAGFEIPMVHSANSAATILWNQTHGSMVRVGIAAYGLWPSKETYAKALLTFANQGEGFIPNLQPVLSWRTRVVQVKRIPAGAYVSYGRTFRANQPMRIAVLPVGYHEGYDRRLSSIGYVLIEGQRSAVCGRVCMNMMMVDVTHLPNIQVGAVATLLGADGDERVSAEQLAGWMGTINYEVVSRIHPAQPRVVVHDDWRSPQMETANSQSHPSFPSLSRSTSEAR